MDVKKPNFLLVGAPKAGTTSIAKYLGEHPEIFISEEKEPFYFISDIVKNISKNDPMIDAIEKRARLSSKDYYDLFSKVTNEKMIGEATVHYLYHYEDVIPKVKQEIGDVSIIIVLRNPSQRAFSNFQFQSGLSAEKPFVSFEDALKLEEDRKMKGYNSFWFYKEVGNYFLPVKSYKENFQKVYICFYEDFKENPAKFMKEMYRFLNVSEGFSPNIKIKYMPTLVHKNKLIHLLFYIKRSLKIKTPLPKTLKDKIKLKSLTVSEETMKNETELSLKKYYKSDIEKLEKMLNLNLSEWYR